MNLLNELLEIHHRHPSWAPEELATDGYAHKVDGKWQLTESGQQVIQPELDRLASVLYPEDLPRN
ncbi:MAG TPA: hypothetical protein VL202_00305 [Pararhizobium sp.]|nr:hypothetical protein [Pararhizobium sp.]